MCKNIATAPLKRDLIIDNFQAVDKIIFLCEPPPFSRKGKGVVENKRPDRFLILSGQ
jgi:hypothetical protein